MTLRLQQVLEPLDSTIPPRQCPLFKVKPASILAPLSYQCLDIWGGRLLGVFDSDCNFMDLADFRTVCSVYEVMGRSILLCCNTQQASVWEQQRDCEVQDEEQ